MFKRFADRLKSLSSNEHGSRSKKTLRTCNFAENARDGSELSESTPHAEKALADLLPGKLAQTLERIGNRSEGLCDDKYPERTEKSSASSDLANDGKRGSNLGKSTTHRSKASADLIPIEISEFGERVSQYLASLSKRDDRNGVLDLDVRLRHERETADKFGKTSAKSGESSADLLKTEVRNLVEGIRHNINGFRHGDERDSGFDNALSVELRQRFDNRAEAEVQCDEHGADRPDTDGNIRQRQLGKIAKRPGQDRNSGCNGQEGCCVDAVRESRKRIMDAIKKLGEFIFDSTAAFTVFTAAEKFGERVRDLADNTRDLLCHKEDASACETGENITNANVVGDPAKTGANRVDNAAENGPNCREDTVENATKTSDCVGDTLEEVADRAKCLR